VRDYDKIYVDGAWIDSEGTGTLEVVNSSTEEAMGSTPEGTAGDVDKAVAAAKTAFETWSQTGLEERGKYLQRISEALGARSEEIGKVISEEVGMPIGLSTSIQAGLPVANFANFQDILANYEFEEEIGNSLVVREPVGVVGAITPWNYPLNQIVEKVAAALAAGCTIVLKPSEVAPLNAFILAEVIDEVGLPAGVFNLVSGVGPVVGEAIAAHPDVDMVSFTGSTLAGRRVSELASATIKRVALELGGKSANIILDDADLSLAVSGGVFACYLNSGQTCSALTRMLVPAEKQDEVVDIVKAAVEATPMGTSDREDVMLGPLISATQRDRVRDYIQKGIDEGATLVTGGVEPPEGLETGYFVQPTVFADVTPDMTIAREEIFGPVLVIMPYEDEDDAVRIANEPGSGHPGRPAPADRTGRHQRRRLQPAGAVRRLQAVRQRARAWSLRSRGVPRGEVPAALAAG